MELKFKVNRLYGKYVKVFSTRNDRELKLPLNDLFKMVIQKIDNKDFRNKFTKELSSVVNEMEQDCRDIVVYCFICDDLKSQVLCVEAYYNDKPCVVKYVTDKNNEYSDTAMRDLTIGLSLYYDIDKNCVAYGNVEITYILTDSVYSLNMNYYDDHISVMWFKNQVFSDIDLRNLKNNS